MTLLEAFTILGYATLAAMFVCIAVWGFVQLDTDGRILFALVFFVTIVVLTIQAIAYSAAVV